MEGRQLRSFTDDYKRQAVGLVASSGRSVRSVARELGLRDSVLRRRMEQRGAGLEPTSASRRPTTQATLPSANHAAEIARLPRENERLRMERDISKNRSRSLLEFRNEIPLRHWLPSVTESSVTLPPNRSIAQFRPPLSRLLSKTLQLQSGGKSPRAFQCLDCERPDPLQSDLTKRLLSRELAQADIFPD